LITALNNLCKSGWQVARRLFDVVENSGSLVTTSSLAKHLKFCVRQGDHRGRACEGKRRYLKKTSEENVIILMKKRGRKDLGIISDRDMAIGRVKQLDI
jgi:hypothetical protein